MDKTIMNDFNIRDSIVPKNTALNFYSHKVLIWILLGVIVAWLFFVGLEIWNYAEIETEPPVFDSLSYAHKAQVFWAAIEKGVFFNPLSLEPTIRPFGTVFVSYPFGYSEDFRGFYFRTMFFPIIILVVAFISVIPFYRLSTIQLLMMFVISVAVGSAPSNYQFQLSEGKNAVLGTWGFVDTFFSAILALTTAFIIRHHKKISVTNAWVVASLAAFSILVKPAGLMTIVVICLVWILINYPRDFRNSERTNAFKQGLLAFICIYSVVLVILAGSEYLSLEHARFGLNGMKLIQAQYTKGPSVWDVLQKLHVAIGAVLTIYLLFGLILSINHQWRRHFFAAVIVLVFGFWLWLGRTSINNVRYFLPFLMMALVIVTPAFLSFVQALSRKQIVWVIMILLTPTLLIGFLLSTTSPPKLLQRIVGINLTSNIHYQEVRQAKGLLDELIKEDNGINIIYYCGVQPRIRAFEAILDWDRIVNGSKGHTIPALPINWVEEHAYRIDELKRARFIVFEMVNNYENILLRNTPINTFEQEQLMIRAWLNTLGEKEGVKIHSQSTLRLLEIIDIDAFEKAAIKIYDKYQWRQAFLDGYKQRWLTNEVIINQVHSNLLEENITLRFKDIVIANLLAVSVSQNNGDLLIIAYVKHLRSVFKETNIEPWFVFVQLLNANGTAQTIVNEPFSVGKPQKDGIRKYEFKMKGKSSDDKLTIAIGIFSPQRMGHVYLLSEHGDWNGKRNKVISIP